MDNSQKYFCIHCGSLLNDQGGFSPDYVSWRCIDCKQVLHGSQLRNKTDRFNGIVWTCESCGSILNRQLNFDPSFYSWPCSNCHHVNILAQEESTPAPFSNSTTDDLRESIDKIERKVSDLAEAQKEAEAKKNNSASASLYCPTCNRPLNMRDLQVYQGYCPYCKNKLFSYQEHDTSPRTVYPNTPPLQQARYTQPLPKYNKYYYDSSKTYAPYGVPVNQLKNRSQQTAVYPPPEILPPVGAPQQPPFYTISPQPKPVSREKRARSKKKTTAFLLCLFFGILGLHYFYVDKVGMGIAYIFTFGFWGIGVIVDLIRILAGTFYDKDGFPL